MRRTVTFEVSNCCVINFQFFRFCSVCCILFLQLLMHSCFYACMYMSVISCAFYMSEICFLFHFILLSRKLWAVAFSSSLHCENTSSICKDISDSCETFLRCYPSCILLYFVYFQKVTKEKKQSDYLKKEIRDLSDQISDMQDDLQTLNMYDSGVYGMFSINTLFTAK